jgi:hypothetical protein
MDQDELERLADLLIESQEKFVTAVDLLAEIVNKLSLRLDATDKYLDASCDAHAAREAAMGAQHKMFEAVVGALQSIQNSLAATTVATNENNERMLLVLSTIEAHFGTPGPDYDN